MHTQFIDLVILNLLLEDHKDLTIVSHLRRRLTAIQERSLALDVATKVMSEVEDEVCALEGLRMGRTNFSK
ncbi:hypothetical protein VB735_32935 [Halotia wernerae UHCC 0503]|nr:hypothetical protein [Halotia wernerae UHCC 0503]